MPVGIVGALHGFLGQGSDWDHVKHHAADFKWHTPSLFAPGAHDDGSFKCLGSFTEKKIFVGYSLGGRIGLSILKNQPQLFDHFIFVSVNPGFKEEDTKSRIERINSDADWANKISTTNWDAFLKEWNSQSVFKNSTGSEPVRRAEDYNLQLLQNGLKKWSLGQQPDYSDLIRENKAHITWVVGSNDEKFVAMSEDLKKKNSIDSYVKIESGHRIPFDSPKKLADIIKSAAKF